MGITVWVLTLCLVIRDGVLNPQYRDRFLLKYVPELPWYWWLVAGMICFLLIAMEGAYGFHRDAKSKILSKHRRRIREIRQSAQLDTIQSNTKPMLASDSKKLSPKLPVMALGVELEPIRVLYHKLTREEQAFLKPIAEAGHSVGKLTTEQHSIAQRIIDKTSWLARDYTDAVYSFRNQDTREILRHLISQDENLKLSFVAPSVTPQMIIERAETCTVERWMETEGDQLIIEEEYFQSPPREKMERVNVALARFRYKAVKGADSFIKVRAQIYFNSGTEHFDNGGIWWQQQKREQTFLLGDAYYLIVVGDFIDKGGEALPFFRLAYRDKSYSGGGGKYLAPRVEVLAASKYEVMVELVVLRGNDVVATPTFRYQLARDEQGVPILTELSDFPIKT